MNVPHFRALWISLHILLVCLILPFHNTRAQTDDKARGIQLYQQDDANNAIKALARATKENPQDAEAWHYLGLSFAFNKDYKKASKAFGKAIQLDPKRLDTRESLIGVFIRSNKPKDAEKAAKQTLEMNLPSATANYALALVLLGRNLPNEGIDYIQKAISINPQWGLLHLLHYRLILASVAKGVLVNLTSKKPRKPLEITPEQMELNRKADAIRYEQASISLKEYLRLSPDAPEVSELRGYLDALQVYAQYPNSSNGEEIVPSTKATTKAVITFKPEPIYTQKGKSNGVRGSVLIRLLLSAEGTVKYALPLTFLPDGMTQNAVKAAQAIKFKPATKDGRLVSQPILIQYEFNIY